MSVTTEGGQAVLERTRQAVHPSCVVCGKCNEFGLGLEFRLREDGGVEAEYRCPRRLQGYESMVHGGVTASLLDGAMTNCLFAHGIVAVTAEMKIRFRHPVDLVSGMVVHGRMVRSAAPLYVMEAEIAQDGQVKATAEGKFMQQPGGEK